MSDMSSGWLGFLGRLHPSLVHLPIGFVVFLAALEVAAVWPRFKEAAAARGLLLFLSLVSMAVTAVCGWILSANGEYSAAILPCHQWPGTGLVLAVGVLWILFIRGRVKAYRIGLGLTLVLLVFTGHYGGILVRGENYLIPSRPNTANQPPVSRPANLPAPTDPKTTAFDSRVLPVFNDYCVQCHGPDKAKGRLRLDSAKNLFQGGQAGPVIQPGSAEQSLLIKRLLLPPDDDEHMPPAGKKQLSEREIALLKWWINVGAPTDKTVNELKMPEVK